MNKKKGCSRWIPHNLTNAQKEARVDWFKKIVFQEEPNLAKVVRGRSKSKQLVACFFGLTGPSFRWWTRIKVTQFFQFSFSYFRKKNVWNRWMVRLHKYFFCNQDTLLNWLEIFKIVVLCRPLQFSDYLLPMSNYISMMVNWMASTVIIRKIPLYPLQTPEKREINPE